MNPLLITLAQSPWFQALLGAMQRRGAGTHALLPRMDNNGPAMQTARTDAMMGIQPEPPAQPQFQPTTLRQILQLDPSSDQANALANEAWARQMQTILNMRRRSSNIAPMPQPANTAVDPTINAEAILRLLGAGNR